MNETETEWKARVLLDFLAPLDRGFTVRTPSPHQVQVMQGGTVFADWWPGKGTTLMDGVRGPKCLKVVEVVAWILEQG